MQSAASCLQFPVPINELGKKGRRLLHADIILNTGPATGHIGLREPDLQCHIWQSTQTKSVDLWVSYTFAVTLLHHQDWQESGSDIP